jgi:hypothetical protein
MYHDGVMIVWHGTKWCRETQNCPTNIHDDDDDDDYDDDDDDNDDWISKPGN